MTSFKYQVQDAQGRVLSGISEADSRAQALARFHERKYRVVALDQASQIDKLFEQVTNLFTGISRESVVLFTRQLAALIRAGLTLAQALESLIYQERNLKFRIILEEIKSEIERGGTFSDALSAHVNLFTPFYIGMVEAGEAAGILGEVLERLSKVGLQELEIRTKLRAAFTYPIILVCVAIFVIVLLLVGAVPKFLDIFKSSQAELPLATVILLTVSTMLRQFWYLFIAGIAGLVFLAWRYYETPGGKRTVHQALFKIPVFGDVYVKIAVTRFTHVLSALTKSGIPLLKALEICKAMVTNTVLLSAIDTIRLGVSQGKNLTELFKASGIFPPMVVQMISVGESTGQLDTMLGEVSSFYELELEYFLKNLTSALEPILLLMMGAMVGFIALAVLMPIFQLVRVFR